jgi:putative iron-regulated protein
MRRVLAILPFVWLSPPSVPVASTGVAALEKAVISTYATIVHDSYEDALAGATALSASIDRFLDAPGADTLESARRAWIDARIPYAQTEPYRFYDGPIDAVEGLVNSWPIDENLIDYVDGEPDAGIINHPVEFPAITADLIVSLNEKGGEKNITAGFHAIEFLLWGQDLNVDGPGRRPYSDYIDGHRPNAIRRREYLRESARLLVRQLERVADDWAPARASNYRARFLALPPQQALTRILKGLGILSGAELAGERLTVPYETKEQEDEHSCFSDNTQQDILNNTLGLQNVFLGRYRRTGGIWSPGSSDPGTSETAAHYDGRGVRDLLAHVDPTLGRALEQQVEATVAAARAVPAPFDRAIEGTDAAPGRVAVKRLIVALRLQSDSIARAGKALGLELNF